MLWIAAAIGTSLCFALSSLLAYDASRTLGAVVFSFVRMAVVALGFGLWVSLSQWDENLVLSDIFLLCVSGVLGVFVADSLRYSSLARVGPQLQSLLNAMNAPFALLLGYIVLGQILDTIPLVGTLVVLAGILIAVTFRETAQPERFGGDRDALGLGCAFGLSAALFQAISVLIAAPVMLKGIDPMCATFIRASAGAASLIGPVFFSRENRAQIFKLNPTTTKQVLMSAALGTGLGMTLQLYALVKGSVGVVTTLSSATPLVILPLLWIVGRTPPKKTAWLGAIVGVLGVALISIPT